MRSRMRKKWENERVNGMNEKEAEWERERKNEREGD
jgi:hypothetical protein